MRKKTKNFGALARRYDQLAERASKPDLKQQLSELAEEWRRLAQVREQKRVGHDTES